MTTPASGAPIANGVTNGTRHKTFASGSCRFYFGGQWWWSMRIMIVTDAWFPQTNGVVHTLAQTAAWLSRFGHEVRLITPQNFRTFPCPSYPEIRISVFPYKQVAQTIAAFQPHAVHIATE